MRGRITGDLDNAWDDQPEEFVDNVYCDALEELIDNTYYNRLPDKLDLISDFDIEEISRQDHAQQIRVKNERCDRNRLQDYGLLLCGSHEEIAGLVGISAEKLRFLAFSQKVFHYIQFQIPKKTGGKRCISAPKADLKQAQNWILHHVLEKIEPHSAAHGFRHERSIVTNAQPHVGAEVIINIDLKDFFPSISYKRVRGLFKSFGYSETSSRTFAAICTEPKVREIELEGKAYFVALKDRCLPQGAPTSPAISNLICRRLDRRLTTMTGQLGFVYTRYADDLTFSASGDSLRNICNILKRTESIIKHEDFEINKEKTRVLRRSRRQEVTGIVVNSKLNISRETLKRFRATLYQIDKEGLQGRYWGQSDDLIAALQGFANFVYMINPEKGERFQQQVQQIKEKYEDRQPREPISRSNLIALTDCELRRLNWGRRQRRSYLSKTYGSQSRQQLTESQLLEFLCYLKSQR